MAALDDLALFADILESVDAAMQQRVRLALVVGAHEVIPHFAVGEQAVTQFMQRHCHDLIGMFIVVQMIILEVGQRDGQSTKDGAHTSAMTSEPNCEVRWLTSEISPRFTQRCLDCCLDCGTLSHAPPLCPVGSEQLPERLLRFLR